MSFTKKRLLLVTSHCDDEIIFFGSLLREKRPFVLCCSNDRYAHFINLMDEIGCGHCLLSIDGTNRKGGYDKSVYHQIVKNINFVVELNKINCIVTHGKDGEYGHLYHKVVHDCVVGYGKEWNVPVYSREPDGDIVFESDYDWKLSMLKKYPCIRYSSWTKYMKAPERYKLCIPQ